MLIVDVGGSLLEVALFHPQRDSHLQHFGALMSLVVGQSVNLNKSG